MGPIQSSITQWGWGFHTLFGGIDPGDLPFCPGVDLVVEMWNDFRSADGNISSPSAAGPPRGPGGKSRRAPVPWAPANQLLPSGVWVSTTCGAVLTRGIYVFVPGLFVL